MKYLITALFVSIAFLAQAQKFGHITSTTLLQEIPEVKTADAQLVEYQKTLETEFVAKGEAFQVKYKAFVEKANSGNFSELQLQREQAELTQEQQMLQKAQQEAQQKMLTKREELYAPIILKVEKAVQEVGKENGYTMIFDASLGGILFGQDSEDVSPLVKTKLGM